MREVIWLAKPKESVRRVYYQSYHPGNLPPFQSSLALAQILESPPGQMPVILAYKMNGQSIPASHGGPVRVIVPGTYGSKSIKWVQRVVLTNDYKANDSDADLNNDTESPMKTQARFVNAPKEIPAEKPAALTGRALVGISGLSKVQYCVHSQKDPWPADDPYWTKADWQDAAILPPPVGLGRRAAGREAARRHEPDGSGQGHAPPMAAALHDCPLGGLAPRPRCRQLRPVLPHHRRQRHRPAHAPPPAAEDRRERHPPRHPARQSVNSICWLPASRSDFDAQVLDGLVPAAPETVIDHVQVAERRQEEGVVHADAVR